MSKPSAQPAKELSQLQRHGSEPTRMHPRAKARALDVVATPPRHRIGNLVGDFGGSSSSATTSKSVRRKPWIAEMDPGKLSELVVDKRTAQASEEFKAGAAVWHVTKGFAYIEDIDLQEGRQKPFSVRCAVRPAASSARECLKWCFVCALSECACARPSACVHAGGGIGTWAPKKATTIRSNSA